MTNQEGRSIVVNMPEETIGSASGITKRMLSWLVLEWVFSKREALSSQ